MMIKMPSKKILSTLVVCLGLIVSVWLFQRVSHNTIGVPKQETLSVVKNQDKIETNEDWKKLLTAVDSKPASDLLIKKADNYASDNTLTSLLAKEMFSKYLLLSQGGRQPTSEEAAAMVDDILSSPIYSSSRGATYYKSNIKILKQNDRDTMLQYNKIIAEGVSTIKKGEDASPLTIFINYTNTEKREELLKLDPVIERYQRLVDFFINTSVPSDLSDMHLEILNEYSNLLANTKDIRSSENDPVRGLVGITKFEENIHKLQYSLAKLNVYFTNKLK